MSAAFYTATYDKGVVALSVLVAMFASYVALDLARRVHKQERGIAAAWIVGGALVMGSGVWSMHFVGMLALGLPVEIGYAPSITLLSWLAAVAVSLVALFIASRERLDAGTLLLGALTMGGGICAMHYIGMAAMRMEPGIVWDGRWVALSAGIACGASAVALLIFFGLRRLRGARARWAQGAAAVVMGLAISGMHYAGMAAAGFEMGSICMSANGLGGSALGFVVVFAVVVLLAVALLASVLDARMQARATKLAGSLQTANNELQRVAFLDALTGVPNRALFEDRLRQGLARVDRSRQRPHMQSRKLGLLFVDLDGFKPVNDGFGHAAGDKVLVQVARRLKAIVRETDTLARLGGDEFVVLLDEISAVEDAIAMAQRTLRTLTGMFEVAGRDVALSCSIGIVVYPEHGPKDKLLSHADAAMYAAKRAGGSTYAVFEERMLQGVADQILLLQDLREAVARGQLCLVYQPKVDARSGKVRGVEALVRWQHPVHGLMSPAQFIPLAERFGLIGAMGDWILDEACRQVAAWSQEGRRLRVSVNLSAHQLRQQDIAQRVGSALARHGIAGGQLLCEITETAVMEDTQATMHVLRALEELGVKLSIDDFGTGHSSLAKLRKIRAHELKIDREFVQDVAQDADARAVVNAIVQLGHALGLCVVAEGVETLAQRDALIDLGCDELQGFLFARPLPPHALMGQALPRAQAGNGMQAAFAPSVLSPLLPP
ncbi:MAG: EAL domain-containing protein [Acidovorax sp.]